MTCGGKERERGIKEGQSISSASCIHVFQAERAVKTVENETTAPMARSRLFPGSEGHSSPGPLGGLEREGSEKRESLRTRLWQGSRVVGWGYQTLFYLSMFD